MFNQMKNCSFLLLSPSKIILFEKYYQAFNTAFYHQMKHHQKYSAVCHIFNSLLSVSSGDETLHPMLDILHTTQFSMHVLQYD